MHTDYLFPCLQPRLVFMFFTGGGGSSADEMYGHAKRSYHQPDDDPVIKEVSMCMIYLNGVQGVFQAILIYSCLVLVV